MRFLHFKMQKPALDWAILRTKDSDYVAKYSVLTSRLAHKAAPDCPQTRLKHNRTDPIGTALVDGAIGLIGVMIKNG
jgi:hypothetical protein